MRKISYVKALNEGLNQLLGSRDDTFVMGQGVNSPWYAGQSTTGLFEKYGKNKVFDTPISENGLTGAAIGAALAGMRPIVFQSRMDFMLYSMDQIVNQAASWHYMFGKQMNVPLTIWAIINRGGQQGAQHSQALQSIFAHIPGLKVVMPSNAYDVKGLLHSCVLDNNPVLFIDERWLYSSEMDVPKDLYTVPIGKGELVREGKDLTIVATSYMVPQSLVAVEKIKKEKNIDVEVIDLRTIKPFDRELIYESIKKTGRLLIVDAAWKSFGIGAEISASIVEEQFHSLNHPIERLSLQDTPAPVSANEEEAYFIDNKAIYDKIKQIFERK